MKNSKDYMVSMAYREKIDKTDLYLYHGLTMVKEVRVSGSVDKKPSAQEFVNKFGEPK